jgi:hypothetical protein
VIVDSFNNSASGMMMRSIDDKNTQELELKKEEDQAELAQIEQDNEYYAGLQGLRRKAFLFQSQKCFDMSITGVIIGNVIVMAMEFYHQPDAYGKVTALPSPILA